MKPVGVQFERPSQVHLFDAGDLELKIGEQVVVQTESGQILGRVTVLTEQVKEPGNQPLQPILRKALETDLTQQQRNRRRELDAFAICQKRARAMNIPAKLVKAQFTLGGGKVTYFFCTEDRVDFRHLVNELMTELGMKVEMMQVGVRDATGMLGGIGICGREYCCSTFLTGFKPISIKMAKVQNLSLNPEKVSGGCGRLRCCLQYELDTYHELSKDLPKVGKRVSTPRGIGKVKIVEILKRQVIVDLGEGMGEQLFRPEEIKLEKPLQQQNQQKPDNRN